MFSSLGDRERCSVQHRNGQVAPAVVNVSDVRFVARRADGNRFPQVTPSKIPRKAWFTSEDDGET